MTELCRLKISHRDIKPHNILLNITSTGEHFYKISDFGFARFCTGKTVATVCGSPEYLHPEINEILFNNVVGKTNFIPQMDLWSIGATLFQLATGRLPFSPFESTDYKTL